MKKNSGFTLVELMVTLAIVGTIATVGLPSLSLFLRGNQMVAASNDLVSAMNVARSEAIKLNSRVSICESANGSACSATGSWRDGWIVFVDADGDLGGTGAPCAAANTDCLLRIHDGFTDDRLTVAGIDTNQANAVVGSITFTSRGLPKNINGVSQSADFSVCSFDDSNNIIGSRAVVLSLSGRVRISKNAAVITCPAAP